MNRKLQLLFAFIMATSTYGQDLKVEDLGFGFKTYKEGQAFTTIAYDSINKRVWGGTNQEGVFYMQSEDGAPNGDFSSFSASASGGPDISNLRIQSMSGDGNGNIWVGHAGISTNETQGGMELINSAMSVSHYYADTDARGYANQGLAFNQNDGLATRDVRSVTTDKNNTVWAAQRYHQLFLTSPYVYIVTPGTISYRFSNASLFESVSTWKDYQEGNQAPELPYPAFTYNPDASQTAQTRNLQAISSDDTGVWVGAWSYAIHDNPDVRMENRILHYNFNGSFANESFTFDQMNFPVGGIINGLCANNEKGIWVTTSFSGKGFSVYNGMEWTYMNPSGNASQIIPSGTRFNDNATWKNEYGNVFLGTNKGLLIYDGRGPVNEQSSYTFYSKTDQIANSPFAIVDEDMASNNITGGVSQQNGIQWIATDNGIMRSQLGFIKFDDNVGVCPNLWRDLASNFSVDASLKQCTNSQDLSSNETVIEVENKINEGLASGDKTYHRYQITTKISGGESKYGTVENIFHILKEQARFQAIIPYDLPVEVLGDDFLREVDDSHVKIFEDLSNSQTEHISSVQELMNERQDVFGDYDILDNDWKTAAGFLIDINEFHWLKLQTVNYYNSQVEVNETKSLHENTTYKLYNNPSASEARAIFMDYYDSFLKSIKDDELCDSGLGLESALYDPVIMHIDDTNYTITNYTKEGHYFHPGKITRTVLRDQETGEVYVRTIGEGLHFCKGELGEFSGKLNTIMGVVLFKNLDIRLRKAFETLSE
ncbi:hypothetical protein AAFN75_15885 [Algibacter sp. AS12]|uniref:hypothetical protein n=1 Tax=Algibacter sp. AS12 TaxID=3135773 RepID=UPI00398B6E5C